MQWIFPQLNFFFFHPFSPCTVLGKDGVRSSFRTSKYLGSYYSLSLETFSHCLRADRVTSTKEARNATFVVEVGKTKPCRAWLPHGTSLTVTKPAQHWHSRSS